MRSRSVNINNLSKKVTCLITKLLKVLAPELSKTIARKALLTPKKSPRSKWPSHVKKFSIRTRHGRVKAYKYGKGKCIWFVHGWSSSAYDFWPLMQQLVERGYCCISFDFPGHGNNQEKNKYSSLPQMVKVFEDISSTLLDPNMVITHSMGASVVANSNWFKQYKSDLLLISPVMDSYALLQKLVNESGFDQELFDCIIHDIYKRDKLYLPDLNAIPRLKSFEGTIKIIHDKHDALSPVAESELFSEQSEVKLITTNKLGHKKILRSKSVLNAVESYSSTPSDNELIA